MPTLGDRIKYIRKDILGITQEEMAGKLGVNSKVTVYNWEKNINEPDINILLTLSKISETSLYWLIANEGSPKLSENINEPKESYGIERGDIELLLSVWHIPEAREKIMKSLYLKMDNSTLAHEIDKERSTKPGG